MTTKTILCAAALFGCLATTVVRAQDSAPKTTTIGTARKAKASEPAKARLRWVKTDAEPAKPTFRWAKTAVEPTAGFTFSTADDDGWKKKAKAAMAKGDYAKAMQIAARALSKNPKDKAAMSFLLAAQKRMTGSVVAGGQTSKKAKSAKKAKAPKNGLQVKNDSPIQGVLELREDQRKMQAEQRARAEAQKQVSRELQKQEEALYRARVELEQMRKTVEEAARRGQKERARTSLGEWVYEAEGNAKKREADARIAREMVRVRGEEARAQRERALAEAERARETARIVRERVRGERNERPDRDDLIGRIRVAREGQRRGESGDRRVAVVRGERSRGRDVVVEVENRRPTIARVLRGVAAGDLHEEHEHEHEDDDDDELEEELDEIEDELEELRDEVGEMREELGEMRELLEILVRRLSDRPVRRSVGRVHSDANGRFEIEYLPLEDFVVEESIEFTPMKEIVVREIGPELVEIELTDVIEMTEEEPEEIEVELELLETEPESFRLIQELPAPTPPKAPRVRLRTGGGAGRVLPPEPPRPVAPAAIATVPAPPAPPAPPKPQAPRLTRTGSGDGVILLPAPKIKAEKKGEVDVH